MFEGFAADAANIASGKRRLRNSSVLKDYYERKERQRAAMRLHLASENPYKDFAPESGRRLMFPKQQLVLETVDARPDLAPHIPIALSETDLSLCTNAHDCVRSCPTGARFLKDNALQLEPRLCVGCGICVDSCEEGACSIEEATAEIYLKPEQAENRE